MPTGYNLCSCAVPASTQTPDQPVPGAFSRAARVEDTSDIEEGMTTLPSLSSSDNPEGPILWSYSDVAASHSPSPVPGGATSVPYGQREPLDVSETESYDSGAESPVVRRTVKVEGDDGAWTMVSYRKEHSRSPAQGIPLPATPNGSPGYQDIVHNMAHMTIADSASRSSIGSPSSKAGPSCKGKTIDAREWGNSGIPDSELDPDVQQYYDLEAEQSMLAHWHALKDARQTARTAANPVEEESRLDETSLKGHGVGIKIRTSERSLN